MLISGAAYHKLNGNLYMLSTASTDYTTAYTDARSRRLTINGQTFIGDLSSVTSLEEMQLVDQLRNGQVVWLSGARASGLHRR